VPSYLNFLIMDNQKTYSIKSLATLSGVSVRTLRYYDQIGLLVPNRGHNDYRIYNHDDVLRLQQILLNREIGFSLDEIKQKLDQPDFDYLSALKKQRTHLVEKTHAFHKIIASIDDAIYKIENREALEMDSFKDFDHTKYDSEAQQKWGESAPFIESQKRMNSYSDQDIKRMQSEEQAWLERLKECFLQKNDPTSQTAMNIAEQHRHYIEQWFYPCSKDFHQKLGKLYIDDERFADHYNKHSEGLATYLKASIDANAQK